MIAGTPAPTTPQQTTSPQSRKASMIDAPQITETTAQLLALIHVTIPRNEVQSVMGPGLQELMAEIKAQGISPVGPWFTHHLKMDPAVFDFEICVPVSAPVAAVGRVRPGNVPVVKVARAIYRGPYEGLGAAWGEFSVWIAENGHATRPDLYESYLAGPESSPDPSTWRTELSKPLAA
jgi:effector-binding domain-containing protein